MDKETGKKPELRKISSENAQVCSITGSGASPEDCMSQEVFDRLCEQGALKTGVYVCGVGYVTPPVIVYGCGCGCGCGLGSGSGCGSTPGEQAVSHAREYEGAKYGSNQMSKEFMDCSELITVAYNLPRRWLTQNEQELYTYGFINPPVDKSGYNAFAASLQVGDVLVWQNIPNSDGRGVHGHAALYAGNEHIYHASSSKGVTETSDFIGYWLPKHGYPNVYRKK